MRILQVPLVQSPLRRKLLVAGILIGVFLASLESTVVTTAMPTVVANLGGLRVYSWVFSLYLLTSTVTVPLWGRLSDIFGRKKFYLAGIGLFALGSLLCGLSTSIYQLVIYRAVQGVGAGAMMPITLTIISELYPLEKRARMQGVFSGIWGFSSIIGPLVGGLITDHFSWRWIFFLNVPFGLLAASVIGIALIEPKTKLVNASVDYAGGVAFMAAVTFFLVALMKGGQDFQWGSAIIILMFTASILFLILFFFIERRANEPIFSQALFSDPVFTASIACGFFTFMGLTGTVVFIPLFIQGVMKASATQAGSALTPLMLGWVTFSIISARMILRFGYRTLVLAGTIILSTAFFMLTWLHPGTSKLTIVLNLMFVGIGMGLTTVPLLLAVQTWVPKNYLGLATSMVMFCRTMGGAIGVAVMGSIANIKLHSELIKLHQIARDNTTYVQVNELAQNLDTAINPAIRSTLPDSILQMFSHILSRSLHYVFLVCLGASLSVLFFLSHVPTGKYAKPLNSGTPETR